MTTAWADLPNATHIDWVLASLKSDPQKWHVARDVARDVAWGAARDAAWAAALDAARVAARDAARGAAWDAARDAAWAAARDATWTVAWDACAALVAWHDCAVLLGMPTDAVRLLAGSGHHPAVLMLPAVIVKNGEAS
jgi:hypothetical protein